MRPIKRRSRKALEMIWSVGAYGGARFPNPSTKVEAVQFVFGFGRPNPYGKSPSVVGGPRDAPQARVAGRSIIARSEEDRGLYLGMFERAVAGDGRKKTEKNTLANRGGQ